jgi:hypothetical protein
MKRELGALERALVTADQHAPFHIVSVLRLEGAPSPQIVRNALIVLQNQQPFLSARLLQEKGRFYFVKLIEPGLIFHVLPRWNDGHWMQVAEVEMGNRIDVLNGPLFRCTYLYDSTHQRAEIILTLYYAIADAASTARLMHELLKACASFSDEKTVPVRVISAPPPVESRFPDNYRGPRLSLNKLKYRLGQFGNEISYTMRTRGKRTPPLHQHSTRGQILSMQLPKDLLEALLHRTRQEEVTLSSALHAAMMIAINRELYAGQQAPMRTFSLPNLRPQVDPPLSDEELGCYISMLRYMVDVEGGTDFWTLTRKLHNKIHASLLRGDQFAAAAMAELLMQRITELKSFRISTTALNYVEAVPIDASYGSIKVTGVHGYLSASDLGPELSAQVHIFNNQLFLDFIYLDADMTRDEAIATTEEIRTILSHAVGK